MVRDAALMRQVENIHRAGFASGSLTTGRQECTTLSKEHSATRQAGPLLLVPMVTALEIFNFVNGGFGILLLCYIIFLAIPTERATGLPVSDKIHDRVTDHLVFVIAALLRWVPCRIYADWHMNFGTFDW